MRRKILSNGLLVALLVALPEISYAEAASANSDLVLDDAKSRESYSIGLNMGVGMHKNGLAADLSVDAFIQGVRDGIEGSDPRLSQDKMIAALQAFEQRQNQKREAAMAERTKMGADNARNGELFMAENAKQEGIKSTESGIQYLVLESTDKTESLRPKATDRVKVHYHGTFIDGTVFDSSVTRGTPAEFPLNGVIAGWTEALQLMRVGDRWRLFIPPDLAYGASNAGPIPPNSTLIFDVELLEIK